MDIKQCDKCYSYFEIQSEQDEYSDLCISCRTNNQYIRNCEIWNVYLENEKGEFIESFDVVVTSDRTHTEIAKAVKNQYYKEYLTVSEYAERY